MEAQRCQRLSAATLSAHTHPDNSNERGKNTKLAYEPKRRLSGVDDVLMHPRGSSVSNSPDSRDSQFQLGFREPGLSLSEKVLGVRMVELRNSMQFLGIFGG